MEEEIKEPELENNKRFNLNMSKEDFEVLEQIAKEKRTSVSDLIRRFIKLGIYAENYFVFIQNDDDTFQQVLII